MKLANVEEQIDLQGCAAEFQQQLLAIKGPKGTVQRAFKYPKLSLQVKQDALVLSAPKMTKKEKKMLYSFKAHIENMIQGVTHGFQYKMKICAGHFPVTVSVKDNTFEIKNFLGETVPRIMAFDTRVSVKVVGTEVLVEGADLELTSQTAAAIEQLTRRTGFDKRIFQDGIYIVEKDGRPV